MSFLLVFFTCLVTTASAQSGCGPDSYTDPVGVISSPSNNGYYDNLLNCDYNVYASADSSLTFIFSLFHVENGDVVTISCPTNPGFTPLEFSGHSLPGPVSIPGCSHGLVNFRTDESLVSAGFSVNYYASVGGCGDTLFTGVNGSVTSPNWPAPYGSNHNCSNIIWTQQQSTFHLHFRNFQVESCCDCDYLQIQCLDNPESAPEIHCGNKDNYMTYVYRCSQVLLLFHSDAANNFPGFLVEYNIYESEGCGATSYYGPSGVISSPNYPNNYYSNLYCNYDVLSSTESSFSFIFKSFLTELYVDYVNISCSTNSSFPPQVFSGEVLPDPVSIPSCSQGRVTFLTDYSIQYTGFTLDYFVSVGGCGNTLYSGFHGFVTSPSFPSYYGYNQNCTNIIWAPQPSHFHLNFLFIDLPACGLCTCDWVEISCLDNDSSDKQRFCGEVERSFDIYSCTRVLVWFHSDSTNAYPGFNFEYNVTADLNDTQTTATTRPTTPTAAATTAPPPATTSNTVSPSPTSVHLTTGYTQTMTQSTDASPDCGETSYYGSYGVISSPNYPFPYYRNLDCRYDINTAGPLSSFGIVFQAFNTEMHHDTVTISCPTNSSFSQLSYSGSSLPEPVSIPWCNLGRVNFHSDDTVTSTGFMLNYYISYGGCGNTVYNGSHGYVASPNFPSNYSNSQNCSNIIWAPKPSSFVISFLHMNLEECCDFVELICLDNSAYGTHKFSGDTIPPTQNIPRCTEVLVWFYSDSTEVFAGFNLEYNATQDPDTTILPVTTVTTRPTSSTPATVGLTTPIVPQSTAGTTTAFVPQNCGNTTYYGPSGVISSPNYPGNYSNYQSCNYYVDTSSPSSSIAVIFEAFDTEQCCDYVTISCPTNSFYPSVKYSGSSLPQPLSIPWCSQAAVNFTSDSATVSSGFSLDYYVSLGGCGDTVYTGSHGLVSSPNYPNSYDSNQNCSNIIWSRLRSSFSITFLYMNVEECCDFVELSCLDNAGFGSHRFTGTTIPEKLDIPGCTQVLVWFYADDTIVQTGFNLEYFVAPDSDDPGQRKVPN